MVTGKDIRENLTLLDPHNDFKEAKNCHLSMLVQKDAFAYAQYHIPSRTYFGIGEFQTGMWDMQRGLEIVGLLENIEALNQPYHSVSLAVSGPVVTLIPKPVFDSTKLEEYTESHAQINPMYSLRHYSIDSHHSEAVYAIPPRIEEAFQQHFSGISIMPIQAPYIDYWTRQISPRIGQHIVLRFGIDFMQLYAWRGTDLILANTFKITAPEDAVYYLLFTMEQLEFDTNLAPVVIQGGLEEDSPIFELIFKYVRNIYMGERPQHENYSFALDNLPNSEYFGLFAQYYCV